MGHLTLWRIATILCGLMVSQGAAATDIEEMGRLLTPAYTAMSLANLCATSEDWRQVQPRGPLGVAVHYAEHVKNEMIEGLTYDDAVAVLRFAADRARQEARFQLRQHVYADDRAAAATRLAAWCERTVRGYIADFIDRHERGHDVFMDQLAQAKRRDGSF